MGTFDVRVHDVFSDGVDGDTGEPLYAALIVAEPRDRSTPLAFHTGLISDDYLSQIRELKMREVVAIEVEDGFFDSDLEHQRKEVVRSAFEAIGLT